jgi:hypothetical protein
VKNLLLKARKADFSLALRMTIKDRELKRAKERKCSFPAAKGDPPMFSTWVRRFRTLPVPLLYGHITSKFLGGVAIGFLIAGYAGGDWTRAGWLLLAISAVVSVPSTKRILMG